MNDRKKIKKIMRNLKGKSRARLKELVVAYKMDYEATEVRADATYRTLVSTLNQLNSMTESHEALFDAVNENINSPVVARKLVRLESELRSAEDHVTMARAAQLEAEEARDEAIRQLAEARAELQLLAPEDDDTHDPDWDTDPMDDQEHSKANAIPAVQMAAYNQRFSDALLGIPLTTGETITLEQFTNPEAVFLPGNDIDDAYATEPTLPEDHPLMVDGPDERPEPDFRWDR